MLIGNSTSTSSTTSTATSQSSADQKQINSDLNQFLKMLVTQLQHQDPLNPMDANQFTQQLVQFASVEQQINQNANLEKLVSLQSGGQMGSLINYIGSMVEYAGNTMSLQGGAAAASYTLPESAAQTTIQVSDASGHVIYTGSGATASGSHVFSWNGTNSAGKTVADGSYTVQVQAKRRDGTSIDVTTHVLGLVTGVANDSETPELVIGNEQIPLSDVQSVSLPYSATPSSS